MMVTDMEVDKVADIEVDMEKEIEFGERVGHGGWLIGPKLLRPEAFPYKLCEFIMNLHLKGI